MNSGRPAAAGRPAQRRRRPGAGAAELGRPGHRRRRAAGAAGRARGRRAAVRRPAPPSPRSRPRSASGLLWAKCCQAVDRHFHSREWLVLRGRARHRQDHDGPRHPPDAAPRPRTCGCSTPRSTGPRWIADVIEELATGGGTLVLTHVDQLCRPRVGQVLADVLEPYRESTDIDGPGWWPRSAAAGLAAPTTSRPAGVVPAHGRGAAAAPPRRGRRRAGPAPASPG